MSAANTTARKNDYSYVMDYSRYGNIDAFLEEKLGPEFSEYRKMWQKVHARELETDFPLYLSIETELRCNFRCAMCTYGKKGEIKKQRYKENMSDALFQKIMTESSENYCPSIGMNVLNEPLLDKKIVQRIAAAKQHGFIDIRMNTNASLMNASVSEELIRSGLTRLYVGIDASTKETYEKIRVGGQFESVLHNIETFLLLREKLNTPFPILRVSFVKTAMNEKEIPEFMSYWKDKADVVSIQEYLSPILEKVDKKIKAKTRRKASSYACPQPFERMIIKGNGVVNPCCAQFNYKLPMGNVNEQSIYEIWNSAKMKQLRLQMKTDEWVNNPVCNACITGNYMS